MRLMHRVVGMMRELGVTVDVMIASSAADPEAAVVNSRAWLRLVDPRSRRRQYADDGGPGCAGWIDEIKVIVPVDVDHLDVAGSVGRQCEASGDDGVGRAPHDDKRRRDIGRRCGGPISSGLLGRCTAQQRDDGTAAEACRGSSRKVNHRP